MINKSLVAILLLLVLALQASGLNFAVKELYSSPSANSNLIYKIPIEVKLIDISDDGNWYKVKLSYAIGPFTYTYIGWAEIPVGETLFAKQGGTKADDQIEATD